MKILENKIALNSKRVRIFLAEKDINIPFEQVNSPEFDSSAYEISDVKPFLSVPSLILESGTKISEVTAICRYFEELEPEPPLMGEGPFDKAHVEMWNRRVELYLFDFVFDKSINEIPAWCEVNRPKALDAFTVLNAELSTKDFIAGKTFSIADISAFIAVDTLMDHKVPPSLELKSLARWYKNISARPSMQFHEPEVELCSA